MCSGRDPGQPLAAAGSLVEAQRLRRLLPSQDEDVRANAQHCGEPGVAVHEVPQTSQGSLDVKSCISNLDQLGLHLNMERSHNGMRIRMESGEEGDWDALFLLCPANH